ncbi:LysR family transcriptional regulator [Pokkaliibacter sp. MBI-7]|uniref:LysR family transcriptional regulator n=1 Tax=Pokkaliibacter sp. MBI-7 TaxID=3040600 RepID=UPI00244737DE|nr:LysR family transcriptional regulator [Pokkaliibacter sp. MBI-7]MDH2434405.1 LysR family transcriptional regulator [Pokkaliibacter sp. MBI-7]
MKELDAMQIFIRVAELASFTAAADSLRLPKSSVSTAIQQLEEMLDTRLLHRTTRRVSMTPDGQVFYERSKDLLADMDDLRTLFRHEQSQLQGRLRVDMPLAVARDVVLPRLSEFLQQHPALNIEVCSTDRRVDLVREGFDCVLRAGHLGDSNLIAVPVGQYYNINCVSAGYAAQFGIPRTLDDLAGHRLVHYVVELGGRPDDFEYHDPALPQQTGYVPMAGAVTVNNSEAYLSACLAGLGIIQTPLTGVKSYLASGALIEVLPEFRLAPMPLSFVYANRRHLPRRVRVFMDWVKEIMHDKLL